MEAKDSPFRLPVHLTLTQWMSRERRRRYKIAREHSSNRAVYLSRAAVGPGVFGVLELNSDLVWVHVGSAGFGPVLFGCASSGFDAFGL